MDAVQRDPQSPPRHRIRSIMAGFSSTPHSIPAVRRRRRDAIEKQLTKIERQPGLQHPLKSQYQPPELMVKTTPCLI